MKKKYYYSFFLSFLCLNAFSYSIEANPSKSISEETSNSSGIDVKVDKSTFLYGSKATRIVGELKKQSGDYFEWKGNGEMGWAISTSAVEKYDLFLIADIPAESINNEMLFTSGANSFKFTINPTSGPWIDGGKNFQRIKVLSEVLLPKGNQEVGLKSNGLTTNKTLLNFRSIELVPVSANQSIEKENQKAVVSRANTEWLTKTGYGVMFHWTSQSVNPDGSNKKFEVAVNDFDVRKFANMVEETGAGYVIFTIGHAEQFCPAPIVSWDRLHLGKTTRRDLIMEIADELGKYNIRLMLYLNSPLLAGLGKGDTKYYFNNHTAVLTEIGNRYKEKVAGYWIDSWYQGFEEYPDFDFEGLFKLCKVGNPNRIFCLNSWIYPSVSPWQEYWAGEVASPVAVPENGFMKEGPAPTLPYQALLIMEPYWVQEKAQMPDPRFTSLGLSKYIRDCMENKGAVTINLGIYQDGTVGEKALNVMKEVRQQIRIK